MTRFLARLPWRLMALLRFSVLFWRELVKSNLILARAVLAGGVGKYEPAIVKYPIDGLTGPEIAILSHSITLTPGTTTLKVADDRSHLILHMFDGRNPEEAVQSIRKNLEAPLREISR